MSQPGDALEREADEIADRVMSSSRPAAARQKVHRDSVARSATRETKGPGTITAAPLHSSTTGQPLDTATRGFFESNLGHDFSQVRIHAGAAAAQSARELHANAYTLGQDITFGDGQFAPQTSAGRRLLAHELAHVVQQGTQRLPPTIQREPTDAAPVAIDPVPFLQPTPDAFSGIELTYMVGTLPATAGARGDFIIEAGDFLLAPQVDSLDASVTPHVAYYIAMHKPSGILGFYVGPDSLQSFIDNVEQWEVVGFIAYLYGYPNDWNRESTLSAWDIASGNLASGLDHFKKAWGAALTDPAWYVHVSLVTAGGLPRVVRAPVPEPPLGGQLVQFPKVGAVGGVQVAELQSAEMQVAAVASTGGGSTVAYGYVLEPAPAAGRVFFFPEAPAAVPQAPAVAAANPAQLATATGASTGVAAATAPATALVPATQSSSTDPCDPVPIKHLGGDEIHDFCADDVPPNRIPDMDWLVNGKRFDAWQVGASVLWEIKTDNWDKHNPFFRQLQVAKQLPDMQRERGIAHACGFDFVIGVNHQSHADSLWAVDPTLPIVVTGCGEDP